MSNFSLWGLILSAGVLAYMTARWEAWVFYQQQKLNKTLLTLIRLATGILLVGLFTTSLTLPHWCMSLLMMMGVFGPVHRSVLNLTRMTKCRDRNRTIKWHSLNKGPYDSLTSFLAPWPRIRFISLNLTEALLASAMFQQLQP